MNSNFESLSTNMSSYNSSYRSIDLNLLKEQINIESQLVAYKIKLKESSNKVDDLKKENQELKDIISKYNIPKTNKSLSTKECLTVNYSIYSDDDKLLHCLEPNKCFCCKTESKRENDINTLALNFQSESKDLPSQGHLSNSSKNNKQKIFSNIFKSIFSNEDNERSSVLIKY
jgi:hypothetical protein